MTNERFQTHYIGCRGVTGKASSESSCSEAAPACLMSLQFPEKNFLQINMDRCRTCGPAVLVECQDARKLNGCGQVFLISHYFGLFVFRKTFCSEFEWRINMHPTFAVKDMFPIQLIRLESPQCKKSFDCKTNLTLNFRNQLSDYPDNTSTFVRPAQTGNDINVSWNGK